MKKSIIRPALISELKFLKFSNLYVPIRKQNGKEAYNMVPFLKNSFSSVTRFFA